VSITRRSAGLPYAIMAITASEPSNLTTPKTLLPKAITTLIGIAQSPLASDYDQRLDIPQVHAYNILRAMFRTASLSTHVLPFLADGIMLALTGFQSISWAVRNCATMLFAVVCARMFGSTRNVQMSAAADVIIVTPVSFFMRYPNLHPFLLSLLTGSVAKLTTSSGSSELDASLFPILTLLARLQPSQDPPKADEPQLQGFVDLVRSCTISHIFQVGCLLA